VPNLYCMKLIFSVIFFYAVITGCIDQNNDAPQKLLASDYRIFMGTKAWGLAKAINDDDTDAIKEIVKSNKQLINVTDPKYGQSVLALAVINLKLNSVKTLLELGANPNSFNNYNGRTPLIESLDIGEKITKNDPRYLNILLRYGGDPNLSAKQVDYGPGTPSPLNVAASHGNLEYVEILIKAGADLNKNSSSILYSALISRNPDLVIYLLNKRVDFKKPLKIADGTWVTISELLRSWTFDLDSDDYLKKMQIVQFLKDHGIDYRKTKIPDHLYKVYGKDYLHKY